MYWSIIDPISEDDEYFKYNNSKINNNIKI
jgi:hypothetical protein